MKLLSMTVPAIALLSLYTGIAPVSPTFTTKPALYAIRLDSSEVRLVTPAPTVFAADAEGLALYDKVLPSAKGLNREAFLMALKGYQQLLKLGRLRNTHVLTIIDYTLSSLRKRLYVVDVRNGKVLYNTYVAHGMNSGKEYARNFSNALQSRKSSLGFYVTMNSYDGKNGLALRLNGVEKGINDNANRRSIVLHGASYVNEGYGRQQGFMGRSEGCPAVPRKETAPIVRSIAGGSAVFVYYPSPQYLVKSKLLTSNGMDQTAGLGRPLP
jgi:hypothetical protein